MNSSLMSKYIKVYRESAIFIHGLALYLEENGISSIIKDSNESARLAGFAVPQNSVELQVLESDVERAKKLIVSFNKTSSD